MSRGAASGFWFSFQHDHPMEADWHTDPHGCHTDLHGCCTDPHGCRAAQWSTWVPYWSTWVSYWSTWMLYYPHGCCTDLHGCHTDPHSCGKVSRHVASWLLPSQATVSEKWKARFKMRSLSTFVTPRDVCSRPCCSPCSQIRECCHSPLKSWLQRTLHKRSWFKKQNADSRPTGVSLRSWLAGSCSEKIF